MAIVVAANRPLISGCHLPGVGIAWAEKADNGYRFVADL
jgi:hypothetical protein